MARAAVFKWVYFPSLLWFLYLTIVNLSLLLYRNHTQMFVIVHYDLNGLVMNHMIKKWVVLSSNFLIPCLISEQWGAVMLHYGGVFPFDARWRRAAFSLRLSKGFGVRLLYRRPSSETTSSHRRPHFLTLPPDSSPSLGLQRLSDFQSGKPDDHSYREEGRWA